jgi:hypothetical protein
MQVDFIVVGPLKTGTSWIYNYLSHHQQISLPTTVKETYFFDRTDKYDRDFADTLSLIKDDIQKLEQSSLFDLSSWKKIWHERGIDIY